MRYRTKNKPNQKTNMNIKQTKAADGLLTCEFSHEISKSTVDFKWTGPKLDPEEWNQVLAFFRWTHEEHNSESQVRFFVNALTREWRAWAFPQKARTGSTSEELDTSEAKIQRAQFPDTEGWLYWGTAHHHMSMSAFQSNTDERNEQNQDGLHLTVGSMNASTYDLHSRMYISGYKISPDLSWFWDVGPILEGIPKKFLKPNAHHDIAMELMCIPPSADQTFPDQWRENVIEIKEEKKPWTPGSSMAYQGGLGFGDHSARSFVRTPSNYHYDLRNAVAQMEEMLEEFNAGKRKKNQLSGKELLQAVLAHPAIHSLFEIAFRNDCGITDLEQFYLDVENEALEQLEKEQGKKNSKTETPYEGAGTDYGAQ
jgi:hypothetical protein